MSPDLGASMDADPLHHHHPSHSPSPEEPRDLSIKRKVRLPVRKKGGWARKGYDFGVREGVRGGGGRRKGNGERNGRGERERGEGMGREKGKGVREWEGKKGKRGGNGMGEGNERNE